MPPLCLKCAADKNYCCHNCNCRKWSGEQKRQRINAFFNKLSDTHFFRITVSCTVSFASPHFSVSVFYCFMQAAAIAAIAAIEMIAAEITIFCSPFHTFWNSNLICLKYNILRTFEHFSLWHTPVCLHRRNARLHATYCISDAKQFWKRRFSSQQGENLQEYEAISKIFNEAVAEICLSKPY